MPSGTESVASSTQFDGVAMYPTDIDDSVTLCPAPGFTAVAVEFTHFDIESVPCNADSCACTDRLQIFISDSIGTDELVAPGLINPPAANTKGWCWDESSFNPAVGTGDLEIAGPIMSTHSSGCLTFVFSTDDSIQGSGFSADVDCALLETPSAPPPSTNDSCTFTLLNFWFQWIFCLLSILF